MTETMKQQYLPSGLPDFSGLTILVAEDIEANYLLIEAILKRTHAKIIWARDGREAVEQCIHDCSLVKLALLDIKMPVMTGLEAAFEIKKHCPYLPVIAQTAYAQVHDRQEAYSAGCDDYIEKPFTPMRLIDIIQKYIN